MENHMLNYLRQNKFLIPVGAALCGLLLLLLASSLTGKTSGYIVSIDRQERFAVKDSDTVDKNLQVIQKDEEKRCKQPLELTTRIEYRRAMVKKDHLLNQAAVKKELKKSLQFKAIAGVIFVNGKKIACLESPAAAERLLTRLKREYTQVEPGEKLLKLDFLEKVKVEKQKVAASELVSSEKAYQFITTGTKNPEKYIVKEGDSLWLIARRNDMYVDDIIKANHLKTENLALDQELILVKSRPFINVAAKVQGKKTEAIPFETKVIVDKNSPSRISIKQEGKNGQKDVVYIASKLNGVVDKREVISEKVIAPAVARIIIKGSKVTKVASRGGGGGSLDWPLQGLITQYFSGGHTGIDIGIPTGTPIRAADSGYVVFTGYSGGYGKLVSINHGNGLVTNYAHCSAINVTEGQQVDRGEVIALSGNTGRSTGPHLHFEVTSGGSFLNPLNYLR